MILLGLVNKILALGVIISQIFVVLATIFMFLSYKKSRVYNWVSENGLKLSFILVLLAVLGSFFYSNYAGFVPCTLCWIQRIVMYCEIVILGVALILKGNKNFMNSGLALALAGLVISIYHNYIYFVGLHSVVCTSAESCATPYVTEFGYITIPMMSLTAFALMSLLLIAKKKYVR